MKLRKAIDKAKKTRQEKQATVDLNVSGNKSQDSGLSSSAVLDQASCVELNFDKLKDNRCVCISSDIPGVEMYKVLRAQIQQRTLKKGLQTVMITSSWPGEGKTLTAINLALAFAKEMDNKVLLVDCDLRRQDIHKRLGISSSKGVIDYIVDDCPVRDIIKKANIDGLMFISGGRTVRDSAELIGSPKMKFLLDELKNLYKGLPIIIEIPPVIGGADAISFLPLVDSIILVVQAGRTSIQDVKKSLTMIPEDKFLGFVLNRIKYQMSDYYGYGYGYGS